nr:MAG TPA: 4Fe-4S binding domain protein [Caudoviricetes sp.]
MAEYIEREAVHAVMKGLKQYKWTSPVSNENHVTVGIDDVGLEIDKIPAADVAPVVRCKDCIKCGFCGADTNLGVMGYYGFCSRGRCRDAK